MHEGPVISEDIIIITTGPTSPASSLSSLLPPPPSTPPMFLAACDRYLKSLPKQETLSLRAGNTVMFIAPVGILDQEMQSKYIPKHWTIKPGSVSPPSK